MSKAVKIITSLTFSALILSAAALCVYLAVNEGIFFNPLKPFAVRVGDNEFREDKTNVLYYPADGEITFSVQGAKKIEVKALPDVSSASDFTFTANGSLRKFSDETNFVSVFDFIPGKDYFTLSGRSLSADKLLLDIYGGSVDVPERVAPVKLVVSSGDKVIEISLVQALSLVLSETSIVI